MRSPQPPRRIRNEIPSSSCPRSAFLKGSVGLRLRRLRRLACPGASATGGKRRGPPALKEGSAAQSALKLDYSETPVALQVALPAADAAVKQSIAQKDRDLPLQIGVHLPMPVEFQGDVAPKLDWEEMDDGSIVSSVSVTSSGASAMRMGVKAELPDGAELRFFDGQSNQGPGYPVIVPTNLVPKSGTPAMLGASAADPETAGAGSELSGLAFSLKDVAAETLWSPIVKGDTIGDGDLPAVRGCTVRVLVEYREDFHIDSLGDVTFDPRRLNCFNHIDAMCAQERFPATQADAVASILFDDDEGTFVCSGTLLNDTLDESFIPYFLTAHHCVPTAEVAYTVAAWWFYRRETCGLVEVDERFSITYGGADLLATSLAQDSSLLRLRGDLPGEVAYPPGAPIPCSIPPWCTGSTIRAETS